MKTKILLSSLLSFIFASSFAQDRTTVNATSSEISDNLDLRAVASIFGDSKDLEDFEFRLNDPKTQISNLDLNNDNQVDYLRVIESVEGRTHLIVIQSVLGNEQFQDVATVEVEKDSNNRIQVQVVGDVYMYGDNYIYEPVYVSSPVIYNHFWGSSYRPYYSSWYWGYYPTYYTYWSPFPVFRYRQHVGLCINYNYQYNYVNYRRCGVAYNNYYGRRGNFYERQYPTRSFSHRNSGFINRYDLDKTRPNRDVVLSTTRNSGNTRENATTRTNEGIKGNSSNNNSVRTNSGTRETSTTNESIRTNEGIRGTSSSNNTVRTNGGTRATTTVPTRSNEGIRGSSSSNNTVRTNSGTRTTTTAPTQNNVPVRNATPSYEPSRSASSSTRSATPTSVGVSSSRSSESSGRSGNLGRR
jgi:hypothetical protein